jgi:hypothetical protein
MTTRLPSKKTGNGRHTLEVRGELQLYPTPAPLTKALLQVEPLPRYLWDPAAGMGHMTAVLSQAGHVVLATDIYDYGSTVIGSPTVLPGRDFLTYQEWGAMPGNVATVVNPPFSLAGDFVRRGLELCSKVCVLGRLAFLESEGRCDIIEGHLSRVYPFIDRPPMMHRWSDRGDGVFEEWAGKKSSSAMAFAWFIFERDHNPSKGTVLKRIWWSKPERNTPLHASKPQIDSIRDDGALVLT